jgi:hypothetical protein
MRVESFRDLLDWTSGYHQMLSHCFHHAASNHADNRSAMLLDYLADKEHKLASMVQQFKQLAVNKALNTWCTEYLDKHPLMVDAVCNDAFNSMPASDIIAEVENQHQQIIQLYQNLYDRSQMSELQQLLSDVADMEKSEAKQMMQGANRLEDI